ncbi:ribose transport system substrate-binding protein [Nonomuraea thailandensis]|uniref:Ribose transport system substrate-binding protein n=1 Tax=Nonomuraea thailandensis TaxID=1188745 RepID=A0A9X2K1L7_9ACTN|nr:sugar ABC transporter substrate-binding protein [Nonomuraea thailandensis]MCP2357098.1 ribose transport system substrate-binding protein [Nonomuraea thailandensis]
MFVRSRTRAAAAAAASLVLAATLAACGGEGSSTTTAGGGGARTSAPPPAAPTGVAKFEDAAPGSGEGLTIGFTQLNLSVGFPQDVQRSVEEQAEKAGVKLITCDSKADAAVALDCAKQFKTQGVKGLITFQADANAAPRICEAGPSVPVMAVDIEQKPCQTTFVGAANEYAGQLVGYNVGLHFAKQNDCKYDAFVSLESKAVGQVNELRMGGIRKGFESVCGAITNLRTLDTGPGGLSEPAQRLMTDTLTALPGAEHVIVVGINEDVIIGALAAARVQNRMDDLYLGVQNLNPKNCVIYTAPHWLGSVAYFPEKYGQILVPNLIKAMKGEKLPAELLVPHEFVTKETVKQYYPAYAC